MTMWVFGYGSLLWHPGFEVAERVLGTLDGYARSFCMRSIHHRGTDEQPGLVLALDEQAGAHCRGAALAVMPGMECETLGYLRDRELISSAYIEKRLQVRLDDGREVTAITYVVDPDHPQYCQIDLETQAQIIARAVGGRGPNTEYLFNTTDHLTTLGLPDEQLEWLAARVRALVP